MKTKCSLVLLLLVVALFSWAQGIETLQAEPTIINSETAITEPEQGFICIASKDGTVYWQINLDTFQELISARGLADDGTIAKICIVPDNTEEYPYLYPEYPWKTLIYAETIPTWFSQEIDDAVQAAFQEWKNDVYSAFDYQRCRSLSFDDVLEFAPADDYIATEADIQAFLDFIYNEDSLSTYMRISVSDTISSAFGTSVTSDATNYINSVVKGFKDACCIKEQAAALGVNSIGVIDSEYRATMLGSFFNVPVWKYYNGDIEGYPYASTNHLWEHGLYLWQDSNYIWRLVSANGGKVLYTVSDSEVTPGQAFSCIVDENMNVYWRLGLDNCTAVKNAYAESINADYVNVQIKPVLDLSAAQLVLPDGQDPTVTRYFKYLDPASVWTLTVQDAVTATWFTDDHEQAAMDAYLQWNKDIYEHFNFEQAKTIFSADKKGVVNYTDEDVELLKSWATVWHNLRDQGLNPAATIKATGYQAVGKSMWDDLDQYILAEWRFQFTACPGSIVKAGYWAARGIYDSAQYDKTITNAISDSVLDAMETLTGSFFTNIDWGANTNGYEAAVVLIKKGLIPSTDGNNWYLSSGEDATVVLSISDEELLQK